MSNALRMRRRHIFFTEQVCASVATDGTEEKTACALYRGRQELTQSLAE